MQLRREIGLQLLIWELSPFFGISFIDAVRKLWEREPLSQQKFEYLSSGVLKSHQNFFIKLLFIPSGPAAVRVFVPSIARSSSKSVIGPSKLSARFLGIVMLFTSGEASTSGPRKSAMQPFVIFLVIGKAVKVLIELSDIFPKFRIRVEIATIQFFNIF